MKSVKFINQLISNVITNKIKKESTRIGLVTLKNTLEISYLLSILLGNIYKEYIYHHKINLTLKKKSYYFHKTLYINEKKKKIEKENSIVYS